MNNFKILLLLSISMVFSQDLVSKELSEIHNGLSEPAVTAFSPDRTLCIGEQLELDEIAGDGISWQWTGPSGFNTINQNPIIPNIQEENYGTYTVTVTDASGCTATDELEVYRCGIQSNNHQDCDLAYCLEESGPLLFDPSDGYGIDELGSELACLELERSSVWVKWVTSETGDLTFVLTPEADQDLDFLVYKISSAEDCSEKELIRCMAAGLSPPNPSEDCIGPTGLAIGETDVSEGAGCTNGQNNFLAPIAATKGDTYIMVINNFGYDNGPFTLEFDGPAIIGCDRASFHREPQSDLNTLWISQNNEFLRVEVSKLFPSMELIVYDLGGKQVLPERHIDQKVTQLPLANLSSGKYVLSVSHHGRHMTKGFVIIR